MTHKHAKTTEIIKNIYSLFFSFYTTIFPNMTFQGINSSGIKYLTHLIFGFGGAWFEFMFLLLGQDVFLNQ